MRHFLAAGSPLTVAHTPDRWETSVMKGEAGLLPANPWGVLEWETAEKIDGNFGGRKM